MTTKPSKEPSTTNFEDALMQALPVVCNRVAGLYGDRQLAEEVSADSLSQAWEQYAADPSYFRSRDLVAWSSRRAAWRAVDRLRRRNRLRPLPEEGLPGGEAEAGQVRRPREVGPAALVRDREIMSACLERLPPAERAVLIGHYFEGRTDQEMGEVLYPGQGTPQARGLKAWRLRQKARGLLRDLLLQGGVDPSDWGAQAASEPGQAANDPLLIS
jgi:DNA-directed RNA polymerase specialized sigma24 family protein